MGIEPLRVVVVLIASYGIGCLCAGYYMVRLLHGEDLRTHGTGSAGGTNAARRLGPWALPVVFVLDGAKGAVATGLAMLAGLDGLYLGAAMLAVVLGHVLPIQLGLRGGRGVSTSMGALLVADPIVLAMLAGLVIAGVLVLRRRVLGGMAAYAALPPVTWLWGRPYAEVASVALLSAAVIAAHVRRTPAADNRGG